MRALLVLVAGLAGCDQVWGLERSDDAPSVDADVGPDEDGDGIGNTLDPCPHLADTSQVDDDRDGIPAICDANDAEDQTVAVFYSFDEGTLPSSLAVDGATSRDEPGTITFGQLGDGLSTLTLQNASAKTVLVDVGFEILEDTVDSPSTTKRYAEIGIYTANTSYTTPTRGNVCFYGRLQDGGGVESLYTEIVENDGLHKVAPTDGALQGSRGRMRVVRTPDNLDCSVLRADGKNLGNSAPVTALKNTPGRIGFSTEHAVVKLRYLYVAYQPLIRL